MKKIFPKISFVEDLPLTDLEQTLKNNQVLRGFFCYHDVTIVILKRKGQIKTLLHELGHWFIYLVVSNPDKAHAWYDKYFTTKKIKQIGEGEKRQIVTRTERYRNVISSRET
jgi:hypothetical protein